ncbi:MAG: SDR family NAD(P)-dependent oxidoreductase [Spartobacteria bacterium]|nr:SDR family NAD(P)-dependent oxidoreductase [Spartobacteria bacterium]
MDWKNSKAVVTGACGFIGSHLVEALVRAGAETTALTFYNARGRRGWMDHVDAAVKDATHVVEGDIRDAEQMRRLVRQADVVFHLAALIGIPYSYEAPRSYVETNVTGTLNMLEAAREQEVGRTLVISTSEVYGSALRVPIDEDHPLQGQSPYSATKIAAEKLAESYFRSFELPVTIVRPFNTFGPRQSARAVIPTILMQLIHGRGEIHLGDPTTTRDFNYVTDTVKGMMLLAQCDAAEGAVVNIGTGKDISIGEVAEMAQRVTGQRAEIVSDPDRIRPSASEVRRLCADNSRLQKMVDWAPPEQVEHGMEHTAAWLKQRMNDYDPDRYYV